MKSSLFLTVALLLLASPHVRSQDLDPISGSAIANPNPGTPPCVSTSTNQPTASKAGGPAPITPIGVNGTATVTINVEFTPSDECASANGQVTVEPVNGETGGVAPPSSQSYNLDESNTSVSLAFTFNAANISASSKWRFLIDGNEFSDNEVDFTYNECSSCSVNGGTCSGSTTQGSFLLNLPTHGSNGGMTTGTLYFFAPDFTFPGRAGLTAIMPPGFTVTRDAQGLITQIDTGAGVMKIQDGPDQDMIMIIYEDANNVKFRETVISLVDVSSSPRLRMDSTLTVDGIAQPTTRDEQYEPSPGVTVLEKGRITAGGFVSLSRESLTKDTSTDGIEIKRTIIEQRRTANDPWIAISDTETTWENQIYGWVKTKEITDPDGEALVSTWEYYQPGENTGPNASIKGLGKLKRHVRYDGYESFHLYGLHFESITTPYAGVVDGKTVTTTHAPVTNTTTVVTTVGGEVVSKRVNTKDVTATSSQETQEMHTSNGEKLTTTTHYKMEGNDFILKPIRVEHSNGTLTTYSYTRHTDGSYTTEVDNGATTDNTTVSQGTRTTTTVNSRGTTIHRKTEAIGYDTGSVVFEEMAVTAVDSLGRALTTAYFPASVTIIGDYAEAPNPAWITSVEYSCCGIASETDRNGIKTFYAYDHLQRRIKSNRLGVTTETHYLGLTTEIHRYPEAVSASLSPALNGTAANLVSRNVRNLAGTLQESWSPDPTSTTDGALVKTETTTEYAPATGLSRRTVTTTPDNFSQTSDSFLDGRTAATTGVLSPAMVNHYSVNETGELTTRAYLDGTAQREITATQTDWAGRTVRVDYMDGAFATMEYNSLGQMEKSTDPDGLTTLMEYNARGERIITATDLNGNGDIDYGIDSVQFSETIPALDANDDPVWKTTSKVWFKDSENELVERTVSTSLRNPNGLSSSTQSIGVANPSSTATTLLGGGNWTTRTDNPDGTFTITAHVNGLMDYSATYEAGANPENDEPIASMAIRDSSDDPVSGYDTLNRPTHRTDSRTGTTVTEYLSATSDVVASVTDPGTRTTKFTYDIRGRQVEVELPDETITFTKYTPRGEVEERSGSQTYPVSYTYDYAGRQQTMTTYGTEEATTTWIYSPDRGQLIRKQYDDGKGTDYTYTPAGRLHTRTWARSPVAQERLLTVYSYDLGGRMTDTEYWGNASLYEAYLDAVENYHTVLADPQSTQQQIADAEQDLQTAATAGAVADTPNVSITHDALGRITSSSTLITDHSAPITSSTFTYNSSNLQIDTETITYNLPGEDPFTRILDRSQDNLGRDTGWTLGAPTSPSASEAQATYTYSSATGRLESVTKGSDIFIHGYVPDSNLLATVTGPQHTVTNIWEPTRNVLASKENELTSGSENITLSKFTYTVNDIGQREGLTPTGSAFANTTPFVWDYNDRGELTSATRNGLTAFEREYSYDGIGNRLTATDHNAATTNYFADTASTDAGGNALNQYEKIEFPGSATIQPIHDDDGNMTSGPVPGVNGLNPGVPVPANATLVWDAENRLITAIVDSTTVNYLYDAQSRLISRSVGVSPTSSTLYIYDGWNRIAEYEKDSSGHELKRTYLWGMDLSGSMQGAGGVGGLLSMTLHDTTTETFYPTYDGNGNISEYVDQAGEEAAHFEYDPFGNLTVDTHNNAATFPYRFSTKPQDLTTGLYYYGYRYFDPVTGRWPSRDPIEERGGVNIYSFVNNNTITRIDLLGMISSQHEFSLYFDGYVRGRTDLARPQRGLSIINIRRIREGVHFTINYEVTCDTQGRASVLNTNYALPYYLGGFETDFEETISLRQLDWNKLHEFAYRQREYYTERRYVNALLRGNIIKQNKLGPYKYATIGAAGVMNGVMPFSGPDHPEGITVLGDALFNLVEKIGGGPVTSIASYVAKAAKIANPNSDSNLGSSLSAGTAFFVGGIYCCNSKNEPIRLMEINSFKDSDSSIDGGLPGNTGIFRGGASIRRAE